MDSTAIVTVAAEDKPYREQFTLEERTRESSKMRQKFTDRVPVIVERAPTSSKNGAATIPNLDRKKFLVPADTVLTQFVMLIRKRISLQPEHAMYVYINNKIPTSSQLMGQIYEENKAEDGFLYILYSGENTYG